MINIKSFTELALSFPGSAESPHFEKASFRFNKKIFATLDSTNHRACLKLSEIDQSVFSAIDKTMIYPVNNKWGKQGWTIIELDKINKALLKDALLKAYTVVSAGKKSTK
ncbi:MAG: MmcQ/YjbR family DNA-binding protein [Ferruginibacter sp.]